MFNRQTQGSGWRQLTLNVSIIIPTLNEEKALDSTLRNLSVLKPCQIIVADGGSVDKTLEVAQSYQALTISSPPGRATQMNSAAHKAKGDILLFLHADSVLKETAYQKMLVLLKDPEIAGGAFSLAIDSAKRSLKIISYFATLRSRFLDLVYGDQGIFVRRVTFEKMAGYTDLPICEDLDLFLRLKKHGKAVILKESILTSPRRWLQEGVVFTTLRNVLFASFFVLGFSPKTFRKWYPVIR